MASRTRSQPAPLPPDHIRLSAELQVELYGALEESEREPGRPLTAEELRRWAETGEWPES